MYPYFQVHERVEGALIRDGVTHGTNYLADRKRIYIQWTQEAKIYRVTVVIPMQHPKEYDYEAECYDKVEATINTVDL